MLYPMGWMPSIFCPNIPVKILMLTAKSQTADEIRGLTCGADDYLRKPFDIQILLLRIQKLCQTRNLLSYRDITLNPDTMEVTKQGQRLLLTKTEYELLKFFLSNKKKCCPEDSC